MRKGFKPAPKVQAFMVHPHLSRMRAHTRVPALKAMETRAIPVKPSTVGRRDTIKVAIAAAAISLIDDAAFAGAAIGWNATPIPDDDTPPVLESIIDLPRYEAIKLKMEARKTLCPVTEDGP